MNASEMIRDSIIDWEVDLNRSIIARQDDVSKELRRLFRELAKLYTEIAPLEPKRRRYRAERTQKFNEAARKAIRDAYLTIFREETAYHRLLISLSEQALYTAVEDTIGAQLLSDLMTNQEIIQLSRSVTQNGHDSRYWWENDADAMAKSVSGIANYALAHEVTQAGVRRELRSQFSRSVNQSATLVQTFAIGNANASSLETYARNSDIIESIQWVATLDTRTSDICRRLDGRRWRQPDQHQPGNYQGYRPIGHRAPFPGPTAHFNERSTAVPIVVSLRELPPAKAREIPEETRSSLDGEVPATTTYYEWLQRTSPARQREALGKERYAIMTREGLKISELLDFRGNPLSVSTLTQRYGT